MITFSGRQSNIPTPFLIKSPWPTPLSDSCILSNKVANLPTNHDDIRLQFESTGELLIRVVTWNQQAKDPPTPDDLALLFPQKYHLIAIGSQECENSFVRSCITPSKPKWEASLCDALGSDYLVLRSHSLQASHIIVFAHKAITHLISDIRSMAVATGLGDKLGNKGGISICFTVAKASFCFVSAHLAAHQHAVIRRTNDFRRISNQIATRVLAINKQSQVSISSSDDEVEDTEDDILPESSLYTSDDLRTDSGPQLNPLIDIFDKVFWFGDLNFRIYGTREVVDGMLEAHMHDALLCNDQLTALMKFNRVFTGFAEGPLNFFPTYKFDRDSDHYDSSQRRRVPSWTDRILYKKESYTDVLSYCSAPEIKTSDHRPVYATFKSRIQCDMDMSNDNDAVTSWKNRIEREMKSDVCCIS